MNWERRIKKLEWTNRLLIAGLAFVLLSGQGAARDHFSVSSDTGTIMLKADKERTHLTLKHKDSPVDLVLDVGGFGKERGGAAIYFVDPRTGWHEKASEYVAPRQDRPMRIAKSKVRDLHGKLNIWMTIKKADVPDSWKPLEKPLRKGDEEPFMIVEPDPWGTPYEIKKLDKRKFRIVSAGPDRKHGTKDDIAYPEE
ncbi:MAG: hypothetical protein ACYTHK_10205 [Planctomycetota bacterium]|jgi:hypothetical protein